MLTKNKIVFFLLFSIVYKVEAIDSTLLQSSNKGWLYAYWGYNRAFYSNSDIHFISPNYDITFYNLSAHDRPSPFTFENYVKPNNVFVTQYNIRVGYFPLPNWHFSVGMDHMKYVVDQGQKVRASGYVSPAFYPQFGGNHNMDSFTVGGDSLSFEHTNGLNLASFDIDYLQPLFPLAKRRIWVKWNTGFGGFFAVTKTELRIFNEGIDNRFHLSGLCAFVKTGPRIEILKYFIMGFEWKAGYMNLPSVLIHNDEPKHAEHRFYFWEYYGYMGMQVPIKKWFTKSKK